MRLRVLAAALTVLALMIAGVVIDAVRRRADDAAGRAQRVALARTIGLPDLALSSGARWLRHPSQVEPAGALSDAPGALDVDPAGAWIAPPREVLRAGATGRLERR
ncbi:hypothetical protein [Sandaracinus amylolyticus]|uniref:Uncharacterized protein n=1 Tax=Sandaracinus amylolyticus TaxID=927083 RepID=A0A0F6W158_9BACT|nr:hypothetical protein [Sandaracinus amylolyticus]AKF04640.1 hypothetical protein DB32_001789 [Sandaracinus amylolyticus]